MDHIVCHANACITVHARQASGMSVLVGALCVLAALAFIGYVLSRD